MDKVLEALKKILPKEDVNEVASAVSEMLDEAKKNLEAEMEAKLNEAYGELTKELATAEKVGYEGYEEAANIVADLRNRLVTQGEEYKAALDEGYEQAYQMILEEQQKNNNLEVEMYEEYDKKLSEMKKYMVEKVNQFLEMKNHEIYESAKRGVLNDPRMAEHKVTLDKIVDITANYLSDEDYALATSTKLEEMNKHMEELKGQLRLMEARNIRLDTDCRKLNEERTFLKEEYSKAQGLITEQKKVDAGNKKVDIKNEQKERLEKSKNVTGSGKIDNNVEVIAEHNNNTSDFNQLQVLAGIKQL